METPPSTPKRKRPGVITSFQASTSPMTPSPQKLVDTIVAEQERYASNSPRTVVANRLGMLDVGAHNFGTKVKQDDDHQDSDMQMEDDDDDEILHKKYKVQSGSPARPRSNKLDGSGSLVVQGARVEANTAPILVPNPRPRSSGGTSEGHAVFIDEVDVSPASAGKTPPQRAIKQPKPKTSKRPASPPPPMGIAPVSPAVLAVTGPDEQSSSSATSVVLGGDASRLGAQSKTTQVSELTWHDSEITGHLGLDPDDDGTGINGVGFRPTAQQTYARIQKRKQQVKEWRERESREARDRRREARFGGATTKVRLDVTTSERGEHEERVVRFA